MAGAFGEHLPYTNFHDLNLDWILNEIKENRATIDDFSTQLEAMGVDINNLREYIDGLDETIQEKIDTTVPEVIAREVEEGGFNELISQSHKRRIVFIGDSYGQGWTPDATYNPWPAIVRTFLGLGADDWYNSSEGGAAFGRTSEEGNLYVPNLIQRAYDNITNQETVTDVVIGLGYNDYQYSANYAQIADGITASCTKSKACFPNARIHIYAIGFTTDKAKQYALSQVYTIYDEISANFQFKNLSKTLANANYFSSDGIHPTQSGQYAIALTVTRSLNNSDPLYFLNERSANDVNFQFQLNTAKPKFNGLLSMSLKNGNVHLNNTFFKIINLGSDTFNLNGNDNYKLAKLVNMAEYTGFYTPRPYDWVNAKFFVSTGSSDDFVTYDASFTLAQDMDHNDSDVYLWIKILGTTGQGFTNITNIYSWGIQGLNMELPFITEWKRK